MANELDSINFALAKAVASRKISQTDVSAAAKKLANINPSIKGIDICKYGICLDYWLERDDLQRDIQDIISVEGAKLGDVRIFKYGIIDPDIFHIQAELDIDEISNAQTF